MLSRLLLIDQDEKLLSFGLNLNVIFRRFFCRGEASFIKKCYAGEIILSKIKTVIVCIKIPTRKGAFKCHLYLSWSLAACGNTLMKF